MAVERVPAIVADASRSFDAFRAAERPISEPLRRFSREGSPEHASPAIDG